MAVSTSGEPLTNSWKGLVIPEAIQKVELEVVLPYLGSLLEVGFVVQPLQFSGIFWFQ